MRFIHFWGISIAILVILFFIELWRYQKKKKRLLSTVKSSEFYFPTLLTLKNPLLVYTLFFAITGIFIQLQQEEKEQPLLPKNVTEDSEEAFIELAFFYNPYLPLGVDHIAEERKCKAVFSHLLDKLQLHQRVALYSANPNGIQCQVPVTFDYIVFQSFIDKIRLESNPYAMATAEAVIASILPKKHKQSLIAYQFGKLIFLHNGEKTWEDSIDNVINNDTSLKKLLGLINQSDPHAIGSSAASLK